MTPPLSPDLAELEKMLDRSHPQVVVVVGAGISRGATGLPHATWLGLLEHGIRHLVQKQFRPEWGDELAATLKAAFAPFQLSSALQHAELVERALNTPDQKAFAQWLESAFRDFKPKPEPEAKAALNALRELYEAGALILTTNYDGLLTDITGAPPVTWEEHDDFLRVMTRRKAGILHIHGHWQRPSSIVLGRSSYDAVVAHAKFQELFRTLWLDWSWIYVGCGDGLDDPNLGRLLNWSKGWGESGLPDFFLALEPKAREIAARLEKPRNLFSIGYPSHDDLPGLLRAITPAARCWPFVRVDESFQLFHVPGANDPFPTRQEYIDGKVPELAADKVVADRLQTHGWATCVDLASVGKTTLALRVAMAPGQRTHPVFYLDLKNEWEDAADASPVAAVNRLARPGTLLILDNVHHQPAVARQLWQHWHAKPASDRGRLLLVATKIHRPVVVTPEQDLTFFETHPTNPAILLQPTPEDLGRLAQHLYQRVAGPKRAPLPTPPAEVLAEWHPVYRGALNAFTVVVLESLADFQRGQWQLPPARASDWVRTQWLDKLDPAELENTICLSAFGAQELEMRVNDEALPYPGRMNKLSKLGLVMQTKHGRLKQQRHYELREPGWGKLLLAALTPPTDEELTLFATASRSLQTALILSSRLRSNGDSIRLRRLWAHLAPSADDLVNQTLDWPLSYFSALVREAAAEGKTELVTRFWSFFESYPEKFAASAWAHPLDNIGSFIEVAKSQRKNTTSFWKAVESQPDKLAASAWMNSLNNVISFLGIAKAHGRDTIPLWQALERQPDKLATAVWASSLDIVGSLLEVAKAEGRDTVPLWKVLESQPDKLAASAWETSLEKVGWFLEVAKTHERNTALLWGAIESQPDKLVASAWQTSLENLGSFLEVAKAHGRDTAPLWRAIESQPDKLAAIAWATSLEKVGSFLVVAKAHERDTAPLWVAIESQPDKLVASAWQTSLENLGSFLEVAKAHGRDTVPLWTKLERQSDKLAASAWATALEHVGSFFGVAKAQGRDMLPLCDRLESDPEYLARKGRAASVVSLASFARYAPVSLLKIALRDIEIGHWRRSSLPKSLTGVTWLAFHCRSADRVDLAEDLLTFLLERRSWLDFHAKGGGFLQLTWLLANVPAQAENLVDRFMALLCTDQTLKVYYAATLCGSLAAGLRQLALHQSVRRCQRFLHTSLGRRLHNELEQFEKIAPLERSQIIQLLGCAELCGWDTNWRSLARITPGAIAQLPLTVMPHRPDVKRVEDYQLQLWLGLRAFVSLRREKLPLPREALAHTLELWRANLAESASTPTTATHRVNQSMVTWLERCLRTNPSALVPSDEPLWKLIDRPL